MAKDPAFLFYPSDWVGGTLLMTRHHKGAYMDLLMAQFNNGHMSEQEIKFVLGKDDEYLWESVLKRKFLQDNDGKYYNEKLDNEIIKRKNFTESRKKNLNNKSVCMSPHMDSHMENENRNIDINNNSFEKSEKLFLPPSVEELKEFCEEKRPDVDPVRFYNWYQSKGWMVGKNKMEDWRAAVMTWEEKGKPVNGNKVYSYNQVVKMTTDSGMKLSDMFTKTDNGYILKNNPK